MQQELMSIEQNQTWQLTDLPEGHKAIGLKWIYKIKKNVDGETVKCKARLVAKGYVQQQGIDFEEIFAPVTRTEIVRTILSLTAQQGWTAYHLDVKAAFLNGELLEEVYVVQPEGYKNEQYPEKVYKLRKALYGLRQAPRAWNQRLDKYLESINFQRCPQEHGVYKKNTSKGILLIGVYVDDLIVTGSNLEEINKFKEQMQTEFSMNDLGKLSYYLGIEVNQNS